MYWKLFDFEKIVNEDKKWWIEIPYNNEITLNTKNEWLKIIGAPIDYTNSLEKESQLTNLINSCNTTMICISKKEIESLSLKYFYLFLKRISKTKEMAEKNKNKLDFVFNSYDNDPREVFEIKEVRLWVRKSIDLGFPWFYILDLTESSSGIKILFYSYAEAKKYNLLVSLGKSLLIIKKDVNFLKRISII